jgi:hypothetical protein
MRLNDDQGVNAPRQHQGCGQKALSRIAELVADGDGDTRHEQAANRSRLSIGQNQESRDNTRKKHNRGDIVKRAHIYVPSRRISRRSQAFSAMSAKNWGQGQTPRPD